MAGLPTQTHSAPSASATKISLPLRKPPSTCTPKPNRLATGAHSISASMVGGTPSNCLPPWLLINTPSHPYLAANSTSSLVRMPLIQICIFVLCLSHGMSRVQLWLESLNELNPESCVVFAITLASRSRIGKENSGGMRKSLRHSLYLTPSTGLSAVKKMALHPAASACRMMRS